MKTEPDKGYHEHNQARQTVLMALLVDGGANLEGHPWSEWSNAVGYLNYRDVVMVLTKCRNPTPKDFLNKYHTMRNAIEEWDRKHKSEKPRKAPRSQRMNAEPSPAEDLFGLKEKDDAPNASADQGRDHNTLETEAGHVEPPAQDEGVLPMPEPPSDPRPVATDQANAMGRPEVGSEVVGSGWDDETPF